ncbi:MAG: HD-GYP domain-containing protein [Thermacetogeniaceae bacterium]
MTSAGESRLPLADLCHFLKTLFPELALFPELLAHSIKTARYACQISRVLRSGRPYVLFMAGAFHDVGKLMIPRSILEKPGPLTKGEWEIMALHPIWSCEALKSRCHRVVSLDSILAVIKAHHEAWDGTGYPEGAKGYCIPVEARILAIADVLDALTSPRPYRSPLKLEEALKTMEEMAGKKLDPLLFEKVRSSLPTFQGAKEESFPCQGEERSAV